MIRVQGEGSSLHHVTEMADSLVGSVELPVVGRPFLLAWRKLLAEEPQGFPTPGAALLENTTYRDL